MDGVVYACDIGSVKQNRFAWSRVVSLKAKPIASRNIDGLLDQIEHDVRSGASIALGFEAPLFMPVPLRSKDLNSGRIGEANRSMFAPVGAFVTTLAIHEAAWILRGLRDRIGATIDFTVDWQRPWRSGKGKAKLLVWEAFVSSLAHGDTHERDAVTAARYFVQCEHRFAEVNSVTCEQPFSLIHCAAIFAGWSADVAGLHSDCLVLKPQTAYDGSICHL
jgi:hypothetical protein